MMLFSNIKFLFQKKAIEPSYPIIPDSDGRGQTTIPGIYVVGELAGLPLVKPGLNAGHDVVAAIGPALKASRDDHDTDLLDIFIAGSGSAGFAATVAAKDLGLKSLTVEAAAFANTFVSMMKGKLLFAEPLDAPKRSRVWFEECRKEELLERWRGMRLAEDLDIREQEKVIDIQGGLDNFTVTTSAGVYRTRRVLLCMGTAGNPRTLGLPGEKEHAAKIHHLLADADDFHQEHITVVGAGDTACEAAIALAEDPTNTVSLSAIDTEFTFPKKRNRDAVRALEAQGRLRIELGSRLTAINKDSIDVRLVDGRNESFKNDTLFEMIGAELPLDFFNRVRIRLNNVWSLRKWIGLAAVFAFVYSFYALKSYGKGLTAWPFELLISPGSYDAGLRALFDPVFSPFAWLFSSEVLADVHADRGYQQGFLYSALYTVIMLVFGYEALMRWRKKAHDRRYQTGRYVSLLAFQTGFFLIVNIIGLQALSVKYAWRAWGLYQPFPLFFNTFFWWYPGDPQWLVGFFIGSGLLGTFVMIPLLACNHGKRFCSWICGCGGLAETLGDRWRHLSPKGARSRAWEFQSFAVLLAAFVICLVVIGMYGTDGNNVWWRIYSYLVDFWLVAVIPIALYPFFGGKVWCRYWCPLAAYNQLLSKWYGRLKIVSDDRCIACAECSKECQVGVDVMSFAKNRQPFDNTNSGCIHCGICIDTCPLKVLSFENSDSNAQSLIKGLEKNKLSQNRA